MRRRLFLAAIPLLLLVATAIAIPAAIAIAANHTSTLTSDRIGDASRFAAATLTAFTTDTSRLYAELDDYSDLFDTPLWLIDRDGAVVHGTTADEPDPGALPSIRAALSGQAPDDLGVVWPWDPSPIVIASPVGHDSQVVAVLVMEVPTASTRQAILVSWAVFALVGTVPAALGVWLLWHFSRWVLRPVEVMDRSVARVTGGDLRSRVPTHTGPVEMRRLGGTFNRMVDTVSSTLDRQQQFVEDAAHQLRGPLTAARLSVENLEPMLPSDETTAETYREASESMERATDMISGLLAATRLHERPARVVSVAEELGAAPRRWRDAGEHAGIAVTAGLDDALIVEPPGGAEAVIDELVDNALRLSGATRIDVTGRVEADRYVVTVRDDGTGLDETELSLATQRFWRAPRAQNVRGTGLGLGIAAQAVGDVGGELRLTAAPGGGLLVRFDLPLAV